MHTRRKWVKRTVERFYFGGKAPYIGVVEKYKYLGRLAVWVLT